MSKLTKLKSTETTKVTRESSHKRSHKYMDYKRIVITLSTNSHSLVLIRVAEKRQTVCTETFCIFIALHLHCDQVPLNLLQTLPHCINCAVVLSLNSNQAHHTIIHSPVSAVSQCKLVYGGGISEWEISTALRGLTHVTWKKTSLFQVLCCAVQHTSQQTIPSLHHSVIRCRRTVITN